MKDYIDEIFDQKINTEEDLEAQKAYFEKLHTVKPSDIKMAKLAELLVLCGARPCTIYSLREDEHGYNCDLGFYYTTSPVPGAKRITYSWKLDPNEMENESLFEAEINKLDNVFALDVEGCDNEQLETRIDIISKRLVDACVNDIDVNRSILTNYMPKANSSDWITEIYGEAREDLNKEFGTQDVKIARYPGLNERPFEYQGSSLKNALISRYVDAERVLAESYVRYTSSNTFAKIAHQDLQDDISVIESLAKQKKSGEVEREA